MIQNLCKIFVFEALVSVDTTHIAKRAQFSFLSVGGNV